MYLSPEQFLEKYRNEGLPYFKIYKGQSQNEKFCIGRFMENPNELDGYDLLNEGSAQLEKFFEMFPDGNVSVVTKGSPTSKENSANTVNVRWGNAAVAGGYNRQNNSMPTAPSRGMGALKEMKEMFSFFGEMMKSQMETQAKVLELNYQRELDLMKQEQKHKEEMEQLLAEYADQPSIGETLQNELIGLIRPLSTMMIGDMAGAAPSPPPGVYGMEKTTADTDQPGEEVPQVSQEQPSAPGANFHPMRGASFDLLLHELQTILVTVFPDYPANEVMPALRKKVIEHAAIIRGQVEPEILNSRQAKS